MPIKKTTFLGVRETGESETVPSLPKPTEVIAILASDLHLSPKPPLARSAEPDWYAAQKRTLDQLCELRKKHKCIAICAGDIFDRWNPPPELINFALENLPSMYAIPGQHDLPLHSYKDIKKSAYWTLVMEGSLIHLHPGPPIATQHGLVFHPFHWGFPIQKWQGGSVDPFGLRVAVVHDYFWLVGKGYEGAPKDKLVAKRLKYLKGYDVVLVGDNHQHFTVRTNNGKRVIWNNGCLMRRKADERDYKPCVGLLHGDGTVKRHYLDCSEDKFLEEGELAAVMGGIGFETLVEELSGLGSCAIDFADAVHRLLERDKVPDRVKALILGLLENAHQP